MASSTPSVIVITGPTGIGKSDYALALARELDGEIINADLGQFYEPLNIGTAKPNWKTNDIAHHLFDIVSEPRNITVVEFRMLVSERLADLANRSKIAIIVGGSTLYTASLFFPPRTEISAFCKPLNQVQPCYNSLGTEELWHMLFAVDPQRARAISPSDRYRIERALNLWYEHGIKPSELAPLYEPIATPVSIHFLECDRSWLYDRINRRVDHMMQSGWLDEVATVIKNEAWLKFLYQKKIIGYDDIAFFLEGNFKGDYLTLGAQIAQKTRNYAKRQITYFKRLKKLLEPCLSINQDGIQGIKIITMT